MSINNSDYRQPLFDRILQANGKEALPENIEEVFQQLINKTSNEHEVLEGIHDAVGTFKHHVALSGAELIELENSSSVAEVLRDRITDLSKLAVSNQPFLQQILQDELLHTLQNNATNLRNAQWGLAVAEAGIAETGTLCLHSQTVDSSLLFLVEFLVLIIKRSDIVARQEHAWEKLAIVAGNTPRAVHLITGPSRTADVEQTLQVGAHGPRELLILMLD